MISLEPAATHDESIPYVNGKGISAKILSSPWKLVGEVALYRIQSLLEGYGYRDDEPADLLQELFLHLQENSCARLAAFRGTTEVQLRAYLREVTFRFALRWILRHRREHQREAHAAACLGPPDRDGPTEEQIESVRREVEAMMSPADLERLRRLSEGDAEPTSGEGDASLDAPAAVPTRTLRHWRLELFRKYGHRI